MSTWKCWHPTWSSFLTLKFDQESQYPRTAKICGAGIFTLTVSCIALFLLYEKPYKRFPALPFCKGNGNICQWRDERGRVKIPGPGLLSKQLALAKHELQNHFP